MTDRELTGPTLAEPGTLAKVEVMKARRLAGLSLHHCDDAQHLPDEEVEYHRPIYRDPRGRGVHWSPWRPLWGDHVNSGKPRFKPRVRKKRTYDQPRPYRYPVIPLVLDYRKVQRCGE